MRHGGEGGLLAVRMRYAGGELAAPRTVLDGIPRGLVDNGGRLAFGPDGPADNPTAGSYVFSRGHRNVAGLAFDDRGRLFASEFGQNTFDELNLIRPGRNYGWPVVDGRGGDDRVVRLTLRR